MGPSGSGKSTFGLAVAGLIPREIPGLLTGSLRVDGHETTAYDPVELSALAGLVLQDPVVQLVMDRVEDDVAFGLENRSWPAERMHVQVPEALAMIGLSGSERRRARELSGGQQQRLALAGVIAAEPGILVLDEPTANLDPAGATEFLVLLADLRARRAATIVLVEHRVEAAWALADLVLALGPDGAPIAVGTPDSVLREAGQRMRSAGIWLPATVDAPTVEGRLGHQGSTGSVILEAQDLRFGYDPHSPVIRDVDFAAGEGERVALIGPNAGGKSTLARLLVGLLRPQHGTVRLAGHDPGRLPPAILARLAGYVFQRPEQGFLTQRVIDEVALGLRPDEREAAAQLMDRLGLPLGAFGLRSPYRMSGGEQRRLSLACAFVRRPRVLILDEPTFGQDRLGYEALLVILHGLLSDGTCLIAATHDQRFVRDLGGRTVTIEDGWLFAEESVSGFPALAGSA